MAAEQLRAFGFEVTTGVGKTGVVGVLHNGDGPTVMLRADTDALPVQEATGLPYVGTQRPPKSSRPMSVREEVAPGNSLKETNLRGRTRTVASKFIYLFRGDGTVVPPPPAEIGAHLAQWTAWVDGLAETGRSVAPIRARTSRFRRMTQG